MECVVWQIMRFARYYRGAFEMNSRILRIENDDDVETIFPATIFRFSLLGEHRITIGTLHDANLMARLKLETFTFTHLRYFFASHLLPSVMLGDSET